MGVKKYVGEVVKEGKRVRWPKKDVFIAALVTTLVICIFCALILRLEDFTARKLIDALEAVLSGMKGGK